jgi:quinol monooxygenase YgiN
MRHCHSFLTSNRDAPSLPSGRGVARDLLSKRRGQAHRVTTADVIRGITPLAPFPGDQMVPTSARMTIEWFVPIGRIRPITMALHSLAADVRDKGGCLGCSVSSDITNKGAVRYVEEWQSEEDLRSRLQSQSFSQLVTLVDDATQPPRIEFALAKGTRGIDFVEEVLGSVP